jgi:hypothetical protein
LGIKGQKEMTVTTSTSDAHIERVRGYKMTPAERHRQRVSLIMGLRAEKSTLTREKVEEVLTDVEGCPEQATTTNATG